MALAPEVITSQTVARAITQIPAENVFVTQAVDRALVVQTPDVKVSQAVVRVLVRGRVQDPTVRAWFFPLDGHDYYVLRLGNIETLVYDTVTNEWAIYGSNDEDLWSVYTGGSWYAGRRLGAGAGTNIVAGSDSNGSLYFLNPNKDTDDDAVQGADLQRPFTRELTAQYVTTAGYDFTPCYGVQLFGSVGNAEGDITLSYSDDRGASYVEAGTITTAAGDPDVRVQWQSLGSMRAPGRLFKIVDDGALRRVDGFTMEGPDQDG